MPRVSVITPCYNSEKHIAETIASVRAQTFTDWEYILVNDGSTDASGEILAQSAQEDARIRVISHENRGKAVTCNVGIRDAAGEYVAVLDHDDLYKTDKLAEQVQYLDTHPTAGMVYSDTEVIDGGGSLLPHAEAQRFQQRYAVGPGGRRVPVGDDDVSLFKYLVVADCIPMLTHLMRRQAALDTGLFDPACWPSDDWDFWIRFSRRFEIHKIASVLASYRWHGGNFSRDDVRMAHARHAVYRKTQADQTLSALERRELTAAINADVLEHISCCLRWGQEAWGERKLKAAVRYYARSVRLRVGSLRVGSLRGVSGRP